ncbi:MAG: hypothetical protein ACPHY8_00140 [Patescibacteria group bacterium]
MNLAKIFTATLLIFLSLNVFSQEYTFITLKSGVKEDLENLISNPNNFENETEYVYGKSISYLKYTNTISNLFEKYGTVSDVSHDSISEDGISRISSTDTLISVGNNSFDPETQQEFFQCVQFIQAISNAGSAGNRWKSSGANLNKSMYLKWRIIAKAKPNGYYPRWYDNFTGHVALAITSNDIGVYVIDQNWEGNRDSDYGKIGVHLIPWSEAENYSLMTIPK